MSKSIEALIEGFKDGGCEYVSNFPGFKSHEIFFGLGGERISINERVAYELAFGASLAGKRSVVSFKGTGLNFAADDFLHTVINGVNAGMVLVLTDDIEAVSSPERQDSRSYLDIFGGLWLEPTTIEQAYDFAYHSFEWSEQLDVPIVIRLTNQFFMLEGEFEKKPQLKSNKGVENRREKYVSYWKVRQDNLNEKNRKIKKFVDTIYPSVQSKNSEATLVFGNCKEELSSNNITDYFPIFTYPLPEEKLTSFLRDKEKINIFEQGNSYGSNKIKLLLSTSPIMGNTGTYKDAFFSWKIFSEQEKLFLALKNSKPSFVVGDEGTFTDESTKTIQVCLAMGTAIGITAGLAANGIEFPWCIVGDTSFNLTGYQSIEEAKERNLSFGIVVIDNGMAKSTGGQAVMGNIRNISGVNKLDLVYDESSVSDFEEILEIMKKNKGISILYIKV